jgi:hypothetical protein
MESVQQNTLDQFKETTGVDILTFFKDYVGFMDDEYTQITNYFVGNSKRLAREAVIALEELTQQSNDLIELFDLNARSFSNYNFWILLEQLETAKSNLETISNIHRYARSNKVFGQYTQSAQIEYSAAAGQTLENIQKDVIRGANTNEDAWTDLAIVNNLREEDYRPSEGGYIIKLNLVGRSDFKLNSIVDGIASINDLYGVDINKNISFEDDDLSIVSGWDTIQQSAFILMNLKKGDSGVFPNAGVDKKMILSNRGTLAVTYPILFRQLASSFATDDTFRSIGVKDVQVKADSVTIIADIETRASEFIEQTLVV